MVTFDHTQRDVQRALSIPDHRSDVLDAKVLFSMINQAMMIHQLFDTPDDAPLNLRTKTGIMERILDEAESDNERIYLVWEYSRMDLRMDTDKKLQHVLAGMTMLYKAVDGDEDKFVEKFITYKNEAKAHKDRHDDDEDDD
jgi:hypothetical protein